MTSQELWTEKYRPSKIQDYVWMDEKQKAIVEKWINVDKTTPNLILSGASGVGKSTLAHLVLNELGINKNDILVINASLERNIDTVRDKITNFSQTYPMGDYSHKYIILEEADGLNGSAQKALRPIMEIYSNNVRFILTLNYANKILPALHGRCQSFEFKALNKDEFLIRCVTILDQEKINFELEELEKYISAFYPDLRKTINSLHKNSLSGELLPFENDDEGTSKDYLLEMVELFKAGHYKEARKIIISQASLDEYEDIYRFFYQNLELWGNTEAKQDQALIIIKNGLLNHAIISDPELNLAATMVELKNIT